MSWKSKHNAELEQLVDELFEQIVDLDAAAAIKFLKTVTAPPEVVSRVMQLIQAESDTDTDTGSESGHDKPSSLHQLGNHADFDNILAAQNPTLDLSGQTLEGLKFHQRLGSGGMGDVYLAEDTRLHRQVAVKVILDTFRLEPRAKERFRREAQILSQLDHPGICRIFNLIEAEALDYLVLEYVDGVTLRSWLSNNPSFRRRLGVAEAMVSALAAAHEQGIVHRDLKPDNIMILADDQIKILDFGISKYLLESLEEEERSSDTFSTAPKIDRHKTMPGVLLGTLQFMSPEQANGEPVGTASDIYSLGILFQLMFSRAPLEPASKNLESGDKAKKPEGNAPIKGVTKELQRLIERMQLVAPAARPTAVEAASVLQRIRQQPQRRWRMGLVATLAAVAVLAGAKYTIDLRHERELANKARMEAEQVSDFLINLFNVSNPEESRGEVITARELLDEGAARIDQELAAHPAVRSRLTTTMGKVYLKLGLYESARQQLQLSLATVEATDEQNTASHVEVLTALGQLETAANNYSSAETWYQKAESAFAQTQELQEKALLDIKEGLIIIYARTDRLDEALAVSQEVLAAYLAAPESELLHIANAYNSVGMQYWRMEQLQLAEDYLRLAIENMVNADANDLSMEASFLSNLALILSDLGELEESAGLAEKTVQIREKIYTEIHPDLALAYDNLAVSQFRAGLMDAAEVSNLKALEIYAETLSKEHADYAWTLANRAVLLREKGDLDGSVETLLEVIGTMQTALGPNHTGVAANQSKLSKVYLLQDKTDDALQSSEDAVATYKASEVEMSPSISRSWSQLALLQQQAGDIVAAQQTLEDLLARIEKVDKMDPAIAEQASGTLKELRTQATD